MNNIAKIYREIIDKCVDIKPDRNGLISYPESEYIKLVYEDTIDYIDNFQNPSHLMNETKKLNSHIEIIPHLTKSDRENIFSTEGYEREMILSNLKFNTHIMMSKYGEHSTSRRFISINDSCLSFTQVKLNRESTRWTFVSRSTELNKMFPSDLATISIIINNWTEWFHSHNNHSLIRPSVYKKIHIDILLTNPHVYII